MDIIETNSENKIFSYSVILDNNIKEGTTFERADFVKSQVQNIVFKKCIFKNIDAKGATFFKCSFIDCTFNHANLTQVTFSHCEFKYTKEFYKNNLNIERKDISHKTYMMYESPFEKAGVSQTKFLSTSFNNCFFKSIGFRFALFRDCRFESTITYSVSFENTTIEESYFDIFDLRHSACYGLAIKNTIVNKFIIQFPKVFQILGVNSLLKNNSNFEIIGVDNLENSLIQTTLTLIKEKKIFEAINALIIIITLKYSNNFITRIEQSNYQDDYLIQYISERRIQLVQIDKQFSHNQHNSTDNEFQQDSITILSVIDYLITMGSNDNYLFYSLEDLILTYKLFVNYEITNIRIYKKLYELSNILFDRETDEILQARYLFYKAELESKIEQEKMSLIISLDMKFNHTNMLCFMTYLNEIFKIENFREGTDYQVITVYDGTISALLELLNPNVFTEFLILISVISIKIKYNFKNKGSIELDPKNSLLELFSQLGIGKNKKLEKEFEKKVEKYRKEYEKKLNKLEKELKKPNGDIILVIDQYNSKSNLIAKKIKKKMISSHQNFSLKD